MTKKYEAVISVPIPSKKSELLKVKQITDTMVVSLSKQFDGVADGSGVGFGNIDQIINFQKKGDATKMVAQAKKYLKKYGIGKCNTKIIKID